MHARFPRLRPTVRLWLALGSIALAGSGCGHDGGGPGADGPVSVPSGSSAPMGRLQVLNDTRSLRTIDAVEIVGSGGAVARYDVILAPSEARAFDVDADLYRVRVHWTNADLFTYDESVGAGELVRLQAVN